MSNKQLPERGIVRATLSQPMHQDAIRDGRAAVMPGDWRAHDPFLSMMNDRFKRGAFGPHPHRGFETVTYVVSGRLRHEDNKGGGGELGPGDTQWMTAGRGVIHNEVPADDDFVHVLQLWLNLPAKDKLTASRYQDLRGPDMPVRREPGVETRVIAGRSGDTVGPAQSHSPVMMLDIRMEAGARFVQDLPAGYNGFLYVIDGEGRFGAAATQGGPDATLWMEHLAEESSVSITADSTLHVVLLAGAPLDEPVAARGPFVMNTEAELDQAMQDYRAGGVGAPFSAS
ncbi:MAG: pirin family protein [Proteobacteria bacterium]|nr:pirin family protein [Pseudomonadota bacterium]MDA1320894.1 pirin family protein [Pseudomonadota bacterium]